MSKQYITILTKDLKYKEYQWKYGLNEIEHFNIEKEYTASPEGNEKELFNTESDESKANTKVDVTDALYVCEIKDFFKMMPLHPNIAYVGYVTIPDDAKIVVTENKIKIMPADTYAGSIVALFLIFCISLLKSLILNVSGWI